MPDPHPDHPDASQPPAQPNPFVPVPPMPAPPAAQQAAAQAQQAPPFPKPPSPLAVKEPWLAALALGGLALAGALAASIVITVLGLIGVNVLDGTEFLGEAVGSQWFAIIIQLLGAGFLGSFSTTVGAMGMSVSAWVLFVPLLVPVGAVLSVLLFGRRSLPPLRLPSRWRLAVAGMASAGFAAVVAILQAVAPITVADQDSGLSISIRAISVWSVIVGILVVAVTAFAVLLPVGATRSRWRSGLLHAVEHLGGFGAVIAVIVYIVGMFQAGASVWPLVLLAPLALPLIAVDASALGAFSSIIASVQGDIGDYLPVDVPSGSLTMFSDVLPLWVRIALPIAALVVIAIASIRWRARRGTTTDTTAWFVLPAAYALFGIGVMLAGRVAGGAALSAQGMDVAALLDSGGLGGAMNASIAPAAWTFLLFAVIGVIVEALARFVVPTIVRSMPVGLLRGLVLGAVPAPRSSAAAVPTSQRGAPEPPATEGRTMAGVTQTQSFTGSLVPRPGHTSATQPAPPVPPPPGSPVPPSAPGVETQAHAGPAPAAASDPGADPFRGLLAADAAEQRPMTQRAKTAWIATGISIVGIVILLVAAVVVHGYFAGTRFSPQAKVEKYLQAIVDGKATDALDLWAPNVSSAERVLLADDIYAAADNRPTDYEIGDVSESEEGATIAATLTVDSKKYDVSFELERAGSTAVVFDDWTIVGGPQQTIKIGSVEKVTRVNGVDVDLSEVAVTEYADENDRQWDELDDIPVLPGDYAFTSPEADGVFSYGDDQTATALPGIDFQGAWEELEEPQYASFAETWTDEAQQEAIAQVQNRIDECMKSDQFVPKLCQNSLVMNDPGYKAVTSITRSWNSEPRLRFEARDDGNVIVLEGGELRIDYKERYSEDDDWESESVTDGSPFGWYGGEVPVTATDDAAVEVDFSEF